MVNHRAKCDASNFSIGGEIRVRTNTHTRTHKGKEEYLYSSFYILRIYQRAQAWITHFYLQIHHALHTQNTHTQTVNDISTPCLCADKKLTKP